MMAMQQMYAPELEAPTLDVMERTVSMFAIMTGKTLTSAEGFQLLTLWSMVSKSSAGSTLEQGNNTVQEVAEIAEPEKSDTTVSPSAPVAKSASAPSKIVSMPAIEEIAIPGVDVPLRKVQNFIKSDSKYWMKGYPWRISVEPFDQYGEMKAYYVHFQDRPTQAEFDEHYALFLSKTCRVHIFESDGENSRRITDEFCSFTERSDVNYPSDETLKPRTEWREGERFRIRFYDERIQKMNYLYYPNKPSKGEVNKLSTAKKVALVEPRPTGNGY